MPPTITTAVTLCPARESKHLTRARRRQPHLPRAAGLWWRLCAWCRCLGCSTMLNTSVRCAADVCRPLLATKVHHHCDGTIAAPRAHPHHLPLPRVTELPGGGGAHLRLIRASTNDFPVTVGVEMMYTAGGGAAIDPDSPPSTAAASPGGRRTYIAGGTAPHRPPGAAGTGAQSAQMVS